MVIKIGSNIASIQAQRRLGEATSSLSKIYERLSSGQRINSASDDVAGLAIADDLNARTRVFTQAIRNGSDGVSLLNIADSSIESLSGVVIRIRELAEQSANGSYSTKQREAMDSEAQALKAEYFRISRTTTFNGIDIFDGSLGDGLRLQLGFGIEGSINASVGGAIGTGEFGAGAGTYSAENSFSFDVALGDLNGDGILDLVTAGQSDAIDGFATIRLGSGNGSFGSATSFATESNYSNAISLGDLNGDGILDLVTAGHGDGGGGFATIRLGSGNGSFGSATSFATESDYSNAISLGDLNGDGILDLVTAGRSDTLDGFTTIRLGTGNGSFGSATSFATESRHSTALSLGDLNGDGILDLVTAGTSDAFDGFATIRLGSGNGSFGSATSVATESFSSNALSLGDLNGDGILDLVTAGQSDAIDGFATIRLGSGNGSFGSATSFATESDFSNAVSLGDLNGDGVLDLVTAGRSAASDGLATIRLGSGNGSFGSATSFATETDDSNAISLGDLNGDGILDLVTASNDDTLVGVANIRLGSTQDGLAPLLDFSLKTKADALQAMGPLQHAQDNLAKQRGVIGANLSRVGIAINNLISSKENFAAAESRIRDADIAADAANLARTQILQQAATSVLAQANQAPALALTLLR